MAVPTVPTVTTLLTEAFRRCGIALPTTAQLTRAEDEWLEEVKRDLAGAKAWRSIEDTQVVMAVAYQQRYTIPSPLIRMTDIWFYSGSKTGTASAGGATSLTVAAGTGSDQDRGKKLFTTGGTGSGQVNRILSRSGDVYTVQDTWATNPASGTTYMIADQETRMSGPIDGLRKAGLDIGIAVREWEEFEGNFYVRPIPDASTYAFEVRGMVDLSLVDETDARLTRLRREWRTALLYGLMERIAEDNADSDDVKWNAKYNEQKRKLMVQDSRMRRRGNQFAFRSIGGLPRRSR